VYGVNFCICRDKAWLEWMRGLQKDHIRCDNAWLELMGLN